MSKNRRLPGSTISAAPSSKGRCGLSFLHRNWPQDPFIHHCIRKKHGCILHVSRRYRRQIHREPQGKWSCLRRNTTSTHRCCILFHPAREKHWHSGLRSFTFSGAKTWRCEGSSAHVILHRKVKSAVPYQSSEAFVKKSMVTHPDVKVLHTVVPGEEHGIDATASVDTAWLKEGLDFIAPK